jgi:hypothetical protein
MKVGVYIHDGFSFKPERECPYHWGIAHYRRYLDWLKAAGVEIVEACQQMGWYRYPTLPEEMERLHTRQQLIQEAHRRGMEYYQILGTNLYSKVPWDHVPPGQLDLTESDCVICPSEDDGFTRTAELSRYFTRVFRGADGFEVFAGDWGGCECGRCSLAQYIQYVQYHAHTLAVEQPAALIWANLWSISSWQQRQGGTPHSLTDPRWRHFWDDEISMSRQFLAALDHIPEGVGFAFPLHHWYRGFCQQWYAKEDLPVFPDASLLRELENQKRPLLAWTHFIVENDPYHGRLWGTLSVRLRYIRQLCGQLAQAPFYAVMGNVYSARQSLNLYAFNRFCRQPDVSVETVLGEFVQQVCLPEGQQMLYDLLVYLENRDPWEEDLPPYRRLPWLVEAHPLSEREIKSALADLPRQISHQTPLLLNGAVDFTRSVGAAVDQLIHI